MNTTHSCTCGCPGSHACDCCTGPGVLTPLLIYNAPGQPALHRRAGDWDTFRRTMQARLSDTVHFPALQNLTTREPDDPSIAFLDAAAVVCDVLTFYSERFANEGYLRTATERRSLTELGKLIGYTPRPGVSASAWLAFTLDTGYNITIPAGTRAQSIPASSTETAQTFETSGDLAARAELNAMTARASVPQEISPANVLNIETIWLNGTGLNLKAGDMLLFAFPDDEAANTPRKVHTVTEDATAQRTTVKLEVERLSAAYYLPVLRKATKAALATIPDAWRTDARPWARDAATALNGLGKLIAVDTSLLAVETKAQATGATSLKVSLPGLIAEGNESSALDDGITLRMEWGTALKASWLAALENAASQEALVLEVFAQLEGVDDASEPLATRKLAAAKIRELLTPGTTDAPRRLDGCAATVKSAAATLRAAADIAAEATTESIWNGSGLSHTNPVARTAFEALGKADPVMTVRKDAMKFLADTAEDCADDAVTLSNTAKVLLSAGTGTLTELIGTTSGAANASVKAMLEDWQASLSTIWTVKENEMRSALSAGTATDGFLKSLATKSADIVAVLKDLTHSHKERAESYKTAAAAYRTLYEGPLNGAVVQEELTALSTAGESVADLHGRLSSFSTDAAAGLADSISLLAGRYKDLASEGTAGTEAETELKKLSALVTNGTDTPLGQLHGALVDARKEMAKIIKKSASTVLKRLDAEIRILSDQVGVSPGGVSAATGSEASTSAAALNSIVAGETLKQPAAPGDPFAVPRSLGSFLPGAGGSAGGAASDAASRLAGKLSGATDDDLFAAWRKLNTGSPAVEVYAFRVQASVFGAGAPMRFGPAADSSFDKRFTLPSGYEDDWSIATGDDGEFIRLDGEHGKVVRDGYIVIERPKTFPEAQSNSGGSGFPAEAFGFGNVKFFRMMRRNVIRDTGGGGTVSEITETMVRRVRDVSSAPHSAYSLSGKATTVALLQETRWGKDATLGFGVIRRTKVNAGSELLTLAEMPVTRECGLIGPKHTEGEVAGQLQGGPENPFKEDEHILMLGGLYQGLAAGHRLLIAGERADAVSARPVREYALVSSVEHVLMPMAADPTKPLPGDTPHTRITLSKKLDYTYHRSTVTVYGNVAEGTHGETKKETLGGGNARLVNQRFELRSVPVTHTAAATATGAESTVVLRVDKVQWHAVTNFIEAGPDDRVFVLEIGDDGKTYAVFGDGKQGSRLPTGVENVTVQYRQGLGQGGNVRAEGISTALDKPLGLKGVINPLAASGGADRDEAEDIRYNAPLPLLALDRLVSVSDYAAFARAYAGIGKAEAALLGGTGGALLHVTIAGQDDAVIAEDSALMTALTTTLVTLGDPLLAVRVQSRELLVLMLAASVRIDSDYAWADVEPALRAAVLAAFGFDRRQPGQDVFLSEVIAVMQRVPGVDFVDVDAFGGLPQQRADEDEGRRALTPEELEEAVKALLKGCHVDWTKWDARKPENERRVPLAENADGEAINPPPRIPAELAGFDENNDLRPAQLALFLTDLPETLILNQLVS